MHNTIDAHKLVQFQSVIWEFYRVSGRLFDWRHTDDPYKVVVSEIMLQQTQTFRVAQKYQPFIARFGSFEALASAPLVEVLAYWQGLGYNRRGMYLHKIAQKVVAEYGGHVPNDPQTHEKFPGLGPATARSICAFAFNAPVIFIETNIRAVYIHHFFQSHNKVHDKQLLPLLEATLERERTRDWYYALMDYGVYLKKQYINPNRKSAHHATQSKFEGSDRQIRGMIIKYLSTQASMATLEELKITLAKEDERLEKALAGLCQEGLIVNKNNQYRIT